jgi:hypothetical protein
MEAIMFAAKKTYTTPQLADCGNVVAKTLGASGPNREPFPQTLKKVGV